MKPKYFYYISKSKVAMLLPQLKGRRRISRFSPKVEVAGLSVSIDIASQQDSDLIGETLSLVAMLRKSKMLKSLDGVHRLNTNDFYHDNSTWFSGLFYFSNYGGVIVASYMLWRHWNDTIVLLIGSPLNILGEKVIRDGVFSPSTNGTWPEFLDFVRQALSTDENPFIRSGYHISEWHERVFGDIPLIKNHEWVRAVAELPKGSDFDEMFEHGYNSSQVGAVDLGLFCIKYLSKLPQERVDTVFKIFKELEFRRREDLPRWVSELKKLSGYDDRGDFVKCKGVYVGSPLYTALA